jgi:hypothetical protein
MLRACVGLLIVVIWQAGRPDRVCQGWAGQEGSTAEANWKASCHAKAVKVCASALACRRVTGTYPPSSFPPRPCSLRHHTTPHAPPRTTSHFFRPSFSPTPVAYRQPPLLLPAYRRHGLDLLVSILVRGGRNSTVDSGVVGGQVRSGSSQVMVLWPRRGARRGTVCAILVSSCPACHRCHRSVGQSVGLSLGPSPSWRT